MHLAENKIYMYKYDYDIDEDGITHANLDEEEDSERMKYNVSHFYKHHGKATPDLNFFINGKDHERPADSYDASLPF